MKDFEKIGKKMPYRESEEDVDALLSRVTARALAEAPSKRKRTMVTRYISYAASAAAVAVIAVTVGLHLMNQSSTSIYDTVINSESMAEVLSDMDSEALAAQEYYTVNVLLEYYVYALNE
ncbi:MAG: hypothetical protein ACI4BH_07905 [Muribaculaceae bacterium]